VNARCDSPIGFEALVAYWSGDLAPRDGEAVEEHVMGCAACSAASARIAAVAAAIRAQIPPILSRDTLAKLRERGLRVVDNPVKPGERKLASFPRDVDVLIHRLGGLALTQAERVDVTVKVEETGDVIFHKQDAPFDREAGEILIACQRHFSVFPPNIVFEVRTRDAAQRDSVTVYTVPHDFV